MNIVLRLQQSCIIVEKKHVNTMHKELEKGANWYFIIAQSHLAGTSSTAHIQTKPEVGILS